MCQPAEHLGDGRKSAVRQGIPDALRPVICMGAPMPGRGFRQLVVTVLSSSGVHVQAVGSAR